MIHNINAFNRQDMPLTYLAKPNKKHIGTIQAREITNDLCYNNISEIKFKVNKYENGKLTLHYNEIEKLKLIELSYIGWFQIIDEHDIGDGENIYKEVTALSLENELTTKILTSFGSMGVESDETGGLDRYCLFNVTDAKHSILHIVLEKAPTWKIGFIDPDITTEYRAFNNDSVDAYSFLTGDVSKEFECIFQFDTFEKSISAYKLENAGLNTSIFLSYRNLVKQIDMQSNANDIKTVMYVAGGDDRGTPLGIAEVNPSGDNLISNFSYYKPWFSPELKSKYEAYEIEYASRVNDFTPAINYLQQLYEELSYIQNHVPSVPHSMNWSEYGLVDLQSEFDYYNQKMSLYLDGKNEAQRVNYYNILYGINGVKNALTQRQVEYDAKLVQIENQKILRDSLVLDLPTYLGEELYNELTTYAHYTDFIDDTFIITDIMTDDEVLQSKRDLLSMAHSELEKICKPSYTMNVDAINFTNIPEFQKYTDQLALGNIITVDYDNDIFVESRLLKIHIDWDNPKNFKLTFSSKNRLDEGWAEFAEIQQQASSSARSQTINGTGWNNAKSKTSTFNTYMNSALDTSLQKLKSGSNEQFIIDGTGTMWKRWNDSTNNFSPRQMWGTGNGLYMTENSWQTVSLAIGELDLGGGITRYGIAAPLVMGQLLLGENLNIINASGNFTINNNGFTASNGVYSVGINPNTPSEIINVRVNGVNQLYIDTVSNKLVYRGSLEAATGSFSGAITGGTLNINNEFMVDASGNCTANALTANGANIIDGMFSGTLTSPIINGGTIKGSYFESKSGLDSTVLNNGTIVTTNVVIYNSDLRQILLTNGTISVSRDNSTTSISGGSVSCDLITCSSINGSSPINSSNVASSHTHSSADIIASFTSSPSSESPIDIGGSSNNIASVGWCNSKFEVITSSDFRLKKNIKSLDEIPLELLLGIKMKQYEFKIDDYGRGINFGALAQEIESLFISFGLNPYDYNLIELANVRYLTDEGMYVDDQVHRINYQNLFSLGICAIQKLYGLITNQNLIISDLTDRISQVESK